MSMIKHLMEMTAEKEDTLMRVYNFMMDQSRLGHGFDTEMVVRKFIKEENLTLTDEETRDLIRNLKERLLTDRMRVSQAVHK